MDRQSVLSCSAAATGHPPPIFLKIASSDSDFGWFFKILNWPWPWQVIFRVRAGRRVRSDLKSSVSKTLDWSFGTEKLKKSAACRANARARPICYRVFRMSVTQSSSKRLLFDFKLEVWKMCRFGKFGVRLFKSSSCLHFGLEVNYHHQWQI